MRAVLVALGLLLSIPVWADLAVIPRYDYIRGKEEELANRLLIKSKLNASLKDFNFYIEGFGEFEMNKDQAAIRRTPYRGYLQEAYLEFKKESFYLRAGVQALRWSEMWSVPSLDIWTGRRWNRLFFDPLAEQLTYPTGVSFSYAGDSFTLDLVGVSETAETTYPVPFTEKDSDSGSGFGGRIKWEWAQFGLSALAAKIVDRNHLGLTANYAFEYIVPKVEYGWVQETEAAATIPRESIFATLGADIFWSSWILTPQWTAFEVNKLGGITDIQNNFYVSAIWNPRRHDVQVAFFKSTQSEALYSNFSYGYNFTDFMSLAGFFQNYEGTNGSLLGEYQKITGGFVAGIRAELSGNLAF